MRLHIVPEISEHRIRVTKRLSISQISEFPWSLSFRGVLSTEQSVLICGNILFDWPMVFGLILQIVPAEASRTRRCGKSSWSCARRRSTGSPCASRSRATTTRFPSSPTTTWPWLGACPSRQAGRLPGGRTYRFQISASPVKSKRTEKRFTNTSLHIAVKDSSYSFQGIRSPCSA